MLNYINQELHLSAILQHKLSNGLEKNTLQNRFTQLQQIKLELQQALVKYKVEVLNLNEV